MGGERRLWNGFMLWMLTLATLYLKREQLARKQPPLPAVKPLPPGLDGRSPSSHFARNLNEN